MADGNTIYDKLVNLAESKADMLDALRSLGATVPDDAKLSDIPGIIDSLDGGIKSDIDTCSLDRDTLEQLVIPYGSTRIGNMAFSGCSKLASVIIPYGVVSIGSDAFSRCTSLSTLVISSSVEEIGGYAFYKCGSSTSNFRIDKDMLSVQAMNNYPWWINSGTVLHCLDGDIIVQ